MSEAIIAAWLLATVAAATFVATDAEKRGLQHLPWTLLTLIAPVIGLAVYLLYGRRRAGRT
jgi:hypothetical protein